LKQNWDTFLKKLENSNFLVGRIISYATSGFASAEKLKDVEDFFASHKVSGTERTIAQSLESIKANISSVEKNVAESGAWLVANYP